MRTEKNSIDWVDLLIRICFCWLFAIRVIGSRMDWRSIWNAKDQPEGVDLHAKEYLAQSFTSATDPGLRAKGLAPIPVQLFQQVDSRGRHWRCLVYFNPQSDRSHYHEVAPASHYSALFFRTNDGASPPDWVLCKHIDQWTRWPRWRWLGVWRALSYAQTWLSLLALRLDRIPTK